MSILDEIASISNYAQSYENYVAIVCPFHNDNRPSLLVYEDYFHCLSCGKSGKPSYLLWVLSGKPQKPAKRAYFSNPWNKWIKAYGSLYEAVKFSIQSLRENPEYSAYLEKRKIAWKRFKLGFLHGYYIIPILDNKNRLVGAVARAGDKIKSDVRYISPKGQSQLLYVPDYKMLAESESVYLTFGMFDAITLCQIGKCGITTTGGKSVNPELLKDIRKKIYIIPDHGEEKDAYKLASELGWRGEVVKINYPYGCKDANDLLEKENIEKWITI